MTEHHNFSFFGMNEALIILTHSYDDKVHFNFIRKKDDNNWEKLDEGLHIELNLKELSKILDFLEHDEKTLVIIHQHPDSKKVKEFKFEKSKNKKLKQRILFISGTILNIPTYRPYKRELINEDIRIFTKILDHLETEKIINQKINK
ncbi:MAG: hypothetical protein ACTSWR_01080 [Candidatus Helarchaeota archaeon]